jgi:hypothetical protein
MPVVSTRSAATQATCGSNSRASSGEMSRTGTPLARPRSSSRSRAGTWAWVVATTSLPQMSTATPCSWAKSRIDSAPRTPSVALRLPGE